MTVLRMNRYKMTSPPSRRTGNCSRQPGRSEWTSTSPRKEGTRGTPSKPAAGFSLPTARQKPKAFYGGLKHGRFFRKVSTESLPPERGLEEAAVTLMTVVEPQRETSRQVSRLVPPALRCAHAGQVQRGVRLSRPCFREPGGGTLVPVSLS